MKLVLLVNSTLRCPKVFGIQQADFPTLCMQTYCYAHGSSTLTSRVYLTYMYIHALGTHAASCGIRSSLR